ncbi:MAG: ferredoxin [Bacilli bacterium]|nr:ferredoxin [Bacilli bacterium]
MEKIKVDEEKCIGCGACLAIDSEHFDINDNGLSHVINNENLNSSALQSAIESCPTGAISKGECCDCCDDCTSDETCNCGCEDCECGK